MLVTLAKDRKECYGPYDRPPIPATAFRLTSGPARGRSGGVALFRRASRLWRFYLLGSLPPPLPPRLSVRASSSTLRRSSSALRRACASASFFSFSSAALRSASSCVARASASRRWVSSSVPRRRAASSAARSSKAVDTRFKVWTSSATSLCQWRTVSSNCLPAGQRLQRLRQILLGRHLGPVHEQRKHPYAGMPQALGDFPPHEIACQVQAATSLAIGSRKPSGADDREHDGGRTECLVQRLDEVGAGIDAGHILKHLVGREVLAQLLDEPRHPDVAVLPPIADEDACHAQAPLPRSAARSRERFYLQLRRTRSPRGRRRRGVISDYRGAQTGAPSETNGRRVGARRAARVPPLA